MEPYTSSECFDRFFRMVEEYLKEKKSGGGIYYAALKKFMEGEPLNAPVSIPAMKNDPGEFPVPYSLKQQQRIFDTNSFTRGFQTFFIDLNDDQFIDAMQELSATVFEIRQKYSQDQRY